MEWEVLFTDEFEKWWNSLSEEEQDVVDPFVGLLAKAGPSLRFPYSSRITTSKHNTMRELRPQHKGRPYRILYAFDPKRQAVLLIGGEKTGQDRWYYEYVPMADRIFDDYLRELSREQEKDDASQELPRTSRANVARKEGAE